MIRAHVDSWITFMLMSKLDSEKTLELAEWGMLEDLSIYIVESLAEQLEKDLNQIMSLEPIKHDDEVIKTCG